MRINRVALWIAIFGAVSGSAIIGCQYFPESTFELSSESRLPKWITLPPGHTRADVSITMSYYNALWGNDVKFIVDDRKSPILAKLYGKLNSDGPSHLKHPPQGFPNGYPMYEVITMNGTTDIIEHRKMEPVFYLTDDPAVWKELGAGGS